MVLPVSSWFSLLLLSSGESPRPVSNWWISGRTCSRAPDCLFTLLRRRAVRAGCCRGNIGDSRTCQEKSGWVIGRHSLRLFVITGWCQGFLWGGGWAGCTGGTPILFLFTSPDLWSPPPTCSGWFQEASAASQSWEEAISWWPLPQQANCAAFLCLIYKFLSVWSGMCMLSCVWLFVTPWTTAPQAPLSMGFFQARNTGVGCHFLLQRIFPHQGSNPCLLCLLHWQTDSLSLVPPGKPVTV